MTMRRNLGLAVLAGCGALGLAMPATGRQAGGDRSAAWYEIEAAAWHRVATPSFEILGDTPARTLRELAIDLEALESLLAGLNPAETPPPLRAKVFVFSSEAAFSRHAPRSAGGAAAAVSGFFLSHPHGDFIAAAAASSRDARRVLYHEVLHRFVRHHLPHAPLWLNEGLAEFYSTLEVGRGEAWVGHPVAAHLARLRRERRRPFQELQAIDAASHVYGAGERKPAFYAEAWAVVHYLLTGDGGRAAVARYAGLLRSGSDPIEAFADVFGDGAELDARVDAHLLLPSHDPLRVHLRRSLREGDLATSILDVADVHHELGWLLAHHAPPDEAAARRHFEAALRIDHDHARALAGVGWLEELDGDDDGARGHYERAVELGPRDPLHHFLEAQSLAKEAAALPASERHTGAAQALLERARDGYRRSLTLEPELAEARAGLGAAWIADRAPAGEGLEALREAFRRLPARDDVLYNLTLYEARLGSRQRAARLYAALERRATPDRVERAREALLRVELTRAERLLYLGRTAEAVEIMSRVHVETRDGDLAAAVASRIEALERALAGGGG